MTNIDSCPGLELPGQRTRRTVAELLGFRPERRLLDQGFRPQRARGLTWNYEPAEAVSARSARRRREHSLRMKSRDLARRVDALKVALSGPLGLETWDIDLAVPLDYDQAPETAVPDDEEDLYSPDEVAASDRDRPVVRLELPDDFHGGTKSLVTEMIRERLGGEWVARWHLDRHPHYVEFRRKIARRLPPDTVEWQLSPDKYSIFIGNSGSGPVYVKTETETPSFGVSASSGGGKTTLLHLPAIHWRGHGGLVDVIDLKAESYLDSLVGVSGFRVHTDVISAVQAMAEFLVSSKAVTLAKANGYAHEIPPRVLLIDEFGSFVSAVENWWKFGLGEKGTPPVYAWFHMILMQGRTKNHRVVVGTHDFAAGTFKGTNVRDLIGTKILLGPISTPKWVTAFGYEEKRIRYSAKHPGRGVVGIAGAGVEQLQVAYISPEDTRAVCSEFRPAPAWFDAGRVAPWVTPEAVEITDREAAVREFLPGGKHVTYDPDPPGGPTPDQPGYVGPAGHGSGLHVVHNAADWQPVSLTEAVDRGIVSVTLEALRMARKKDASFPESVGRTGRDLLYNADSLTRWEGARGTAKAAGGQA